MDEQPSLSTWIAVYWLAASVGSLRAEDLPALQARIAREEHREPVRLTVEALPVHDGRH